MNPANDQYHREIAVATANAKYVCPLSHDGSVDGKPMRLVWQANIKGKDGVVFAFYVCMKNTDHRLSHDLSTGKWYVGGEVLDGS